MPTVDSKGRIVLPQEIRDRLGIDPGSEVEVREEDGRVVVEPEDDPAEIIATLESLIEETAADRDRTPYTELDPAARDHADTIREQATKRDGDE